MSALFKMLVGFASVTVLMGGSYWYIPEARFLGAKAVAVDLCFAEADGQVRYLDDWMGKVVLAPRRMACVNGELLKDRSGNMALARMAPIEGEVLPVIE
ncbi:MAG: hypothetical protein N4A70_13330 [Pelagimonas sp.]|jgi:hypothetical protein|nr:hypothetical protein [Pelagimonas sp.]